MKARLLSGTRLRLSPVILGCADFGERVPRESAQVVVRAALDADITMFDTADVYAYGESERILGSALGTRRAEVLISSKFGNPSYDMGYGDLGPRGGGRYIRRAVDESLRRLGTDWIDLYQLHCPDPSVPIEETAGVLAELAAAGKIIRFGHSNFAGWQVCDGWHAAHSAGLPQFVTTQTRYSLLDRQADTEILPACERFGVSVLAYAPLAKGLLTGALADARDLPESSRMATSPEMVTAARLSKVSELKAFCTERGLSLTGVAIAAVLAQPAIASCVLGASRAEQVRDAAAAATVELTSSDLERIDAISPPRPFTLWTAPAQPTTAATQSST